MASLKLLRRHFLITMCVAALNTIVPRASQAQQAVEEKPPAADLLSQFMDASGKLTGYDNLDRATGSTYLNAIVQDQNRLTPLEILLANGDFKAGKPIGDPVALEMANEILNNWFSGICQKKEGPTTVTWRAALAWTACTFTKPPGECPPRTNPGWASVPRM